MSVFLGRPPQYVSNWIEKTTKWTRLIQQIESQSDSLPAVGSSLTVPYKVDPNGEAVDTEWMILGYNKDIPRFVKYKNGNTRVYMDVLSEDLLLASFSGANVYSSKDGTGLVGTVSATGETSFTYGNNNTYSVPRTITVNGTTYEFCGYNMTLQSKYGLVVKYDGTLYTKAQFNSHNFNDWKTSDIREWLNGTGAVSTQRWYPQSGDSTTGTIVGLLGRLTDTNFTGNVIPTVTRTWTDSYWRDETEDANGCQHLADRFRLLGVGEVNCKGSDTTQWFPDGGASVDGDNKGYDTSRFDDVFNEADVKTREETREREIMNENGTDSGSTCDWWLRSARSDHSGYAGYVGHGGGGVNGSFAGYNYAVLPACLIG